MSVDLNTVAEAVWTYTCALAEASADAKPTLKIRCADPCGALLGRVGSTSAGPLFTSSWVVELPLPYQIQVGDRVLGRGEAVRWDRGERDRTVVATSGPAMTYSGRDGLFAALAIPPDLPQTYTPLYVRCDMHGDAVIDRSAVINALRGKARVLQVRPSLPVQEYVAQRNDGLPREMTTQSETRQHS